MFDTENCIYHYTTAGRCIDDILPSMSLRMGTFEGLNDPREAKTWPFRFYSRDASAFDRDLFRQATDIVTRQSLMLSCSRNNPEGDRYDQLRLGFAHPRMWAQYGEGHRGVCLALDTTELDKAVREAAGAKPVFCGPVDYFQSGHAPSGSEGDPYGIVYLEDIETRGLQAMVDALVMQYHRHLFFTKHLDWRDEWEFRWVVRSGDGQPLFVPIAGALRAVLVGQDCRPDDLEKVLGICRPAGKPVHRVYWHGWSISVFGDPVEDEPADPLSLNGISFSTKIPCSSVFTHGLGHDGRVRTVEIRSSGDVVPLD